MYCFKVFTPNIGGLASLSFVQVRFATKKAQGSSRNGRDSNPKYRGIKKNHLEQVMVILFIFF